MRRSRGVPARRTTARENLASNLLLAMKRAGLEHHPKTFAQRIGLSAGALALMLHPTEVATVPMATLEEIASAMHVKPWQLIIDPETPLKAGDFLEPRLKKRR
jgi:DNA-binding Xre family transcriptional regulator